MPRNPWLAIDAATSPALRARELRHEWEQFLSGGPVTAVREPVADSWRRSLDAGVDPSGNRLAPVSADRDEASARWEAHPLRQAAPLIRECLAAVADESGARRGDRAGGRAAGRGARAGRGRPRRAARARARDPAGRTQPGRAGRRDQHARRARPPAHLGRGHRRATAGGAGGDRLLHRRRGTDQRRQARAGQQRPDHGGRPRRRAAARGPRRRRRRRAQRSELGLLGLRDRAAALDGELRVDSPPGEGTVVAATLPIPAPAANNA